MPYDNDENWHVQFHVKIIVGILGKIRLLSHELETETRLYAFTWRILNFSNDNFKSITRKICFV